MGRWDLPAVGLVGYRLPWLVMSGAVVAGTGALLGQVTLHRPGAGLRWLLALWLVSGALLTWRSTEKLLARLVGCRAPVEGERDRLAAAWRQVSAAAGIDDERYVLWVKHSDRVNAFAGLGHLIAVTQYAVEMLSPAQLAAVLAHELGHHLHGHAWIRLLTSWYSLPARGLWWLVTRLLAGFPFARVVGGFVILALGVILVGLTTHGFPWLGGVVALLAGTPLLGAWSARGAELRADRFAEQLGYGTALLTVLTDEPHRGGEDGWVLARALGSRPSRLARIRRLTPPAASAVPVSEAMAMAAPDPGDEDGPAPAAGRQRLAEHNLRHGQVRLGRVVPTAYAGTGPGPDFGLDQDVLRTSLLVVGPPGSGKTRGFALPIVEHLSLAAGRGQASVVVVDPKGDDFDYPDWFDVTIDPLAPDVGFDLFGGSPSADIAADRLASALLPPQVSDDLAYFMDAARNALHACLSPFHLAFGRWPRIRELLSLLRGEQGITDRVKGALRGPGAREAKELLGTRAAQRVARSDPAASLVERLGLLDRPRLVRLFDHPHRMFRMRDLNEPVRVRIALPEAELPDASRILARLVVSQFVQVTSASDTNRRIFKALVIDEAGRFVDDYVARGVQKLRSHNAGLVLLAQTVSDFPAAVRATVFGSVGGKAVFGGVDPQDAEVFSAWFGATWVPEVTRSRTERTSFTESGASTAFGTGESAGVSMRRVERPRWSVSDIVTGIPAGHCVVAVSRSTGERSDPLLVNLRG